MTATAIAVYKPDLTALHQLMRFVVGRLDDDARALLRARRSGASNRTWTEHRHEVEISARREIVGVMQRMFVLRDMPAEEPVRRCAFDVLCSIAGVYTDHPAYDPSWGVAERETG